MSTEKNITVAPLRVGIRFSPPALVLVYEKKSGELFPSGVLRRRIMPIRDFNEASDIQCFARELLDRHGKVLFENVPIETVCKMLRILREHRKGFDLKTALEIVEEETCQTEGVNEMQKKEMDNSPKKNGINKTFIVEKDENNSTNFSREKEESYEVEVDRSWDDDGDDSLDMNMRRNFTTDFVKDFES